MSEYPMSAEELQAEATYEVGMSIAARLHDEGLLTSEEFEQVRQRLAKRSRALLLRLDSAVSDWIKQAF